jgi:hypothetical protein
MPYCVNLISLSSGLCSNATMPSSIRSFGYSYVRQAGVLFRSCLGTHLCSGNVE